ncbi:ABC transporter permease [bacterium]|nr:ABC transporter permease [bacterium]
MSSRLADSLERFGRFCLLSGDIVERGLLQSLRGKFPKGAEIVWFIHRMGVGSVPIVVLICGFVGMILAMQTAYQLAKFGATLYVASLVSVSVVRELGPLITAILVSGRVGAGVAAELGTMAVSEEITALRTMALNPVRILLVPRVAGLIIALPILTLIGDSVAIAGGLVIGWGYLHLPPELFYKVAVEGLVMKDFLTGFAKSIIFAILIGLIACYKGYYVRGGAVGVGTATTETVVMSIVAIIVADLLFTALFYFAI